MSTAAAFRQVARSNAKFTFNSRVVASIALAGSIGAFTYNYNNNNNNNNNKGNTPKDIANKALFGFGASKAVDANVSTNVREAKPVVTDTAYYQRVYNAIAQKLIDEDDFDDGSYGPILVRLAWHNSGSYNQNDKSDTKGGSYAGTMRYDKEQADPENAGLETAMKFLEPIRKQFPELSHGDLYTLGGVVSIQEMSGPKISWRPGRVDLPVEVTPPYHRIPDASQTSGNYLREVFTDRLGFTDEELVALIGVGHSIGRCHVKNSGFDGPWTFSPTTVTNQFFVLLLDENWDWKKWDGKKQYEDTKTKSLMMLPTDMAMKKDGNMKKIMEDFAKDEEKCMKVFASAFSRLLERGIKFNTEPILFKTLEEQNL